MAWTMSVALRESCVIGQDAHGDQARGWFNGALQRAGRLIARARRQSQTPVVAPVSAPPGVPDTARATQSGVAMISPSRQPFAMPDPDQLTARISHDLRTPLNAVLGFSELMQQAVSDRDPDCRYRAYAANIQQSGQALLKATEETLVVTQMIAAAARPDHRSHRRLASMASIFATLTEKTDTLVWDPARLATALVHEPQVEGCEAAYREALSRLVRTFDSAAPNARHRLHLETVDDQLLITLETPAAGPTDTRQSGKPAATPYPLTTDTLDLFIVQTMFALQGAEMSWVTDHDGRQLTARILLPLAAQWSLPLEA